MKFNLDKDLIFFDIESTGTNVLRDKILQIALVKYEVGKEEPKELMLMINPGIPIHPEAMKVHGITPDMLRNKPTFAQVASELLEFIGDADLSGYNSNRFDIPMLMEEFARVGEEFDISKRKTIDVQRIFYKMEPRTLTAAYRYYCNGAKMENAHDAMADVKATIEVFKGQLEMYKDTDYIDHNDAIIEKPIRNDMQQLHEFTTDFTVVDSTNRLKYNADKVVVFNFGKYIGQPVADVLAKDKNYYSWIMNKEFSTQVKNAVKQIVADYEKEHPMD